MARSLQLVPLAHLGPLPSVGALSNIDSLNGLGAIDHDGSLRNHGVLSPLMARSPHLVIFRSFGSLIFHGTLNWDGPLQDDGCSHWSWPALSNCCRRHLWLHSGATV